MVLSNLKPGHTMAGDWRRLAKVKYCDSNRVFCMMVVTMYCRMFHQRALLPDYARRCLEEVRPGVGPQPRSVQPPTPGAHHPRYLGHRSHSVDTGQGQWDPTGTKPKNNLP